MKLLVPGSAATLSDERLIGICAAVQRRQDFVRQTMNSVARM